MIKQKLNDIWDGMNPNRKALFVNRNFKLIYRLAESDPTLKSWTKRFEEVMFQLTKADYSNLISNGFIINDLKEKVLDKIEITSDSSQNLLLNFYFSYNSSIDNPYKNKSSYYLKFLLLANQKEQLPVFSKSNTSDSYDFQKKQQFILDLIKELITSGLPTVVYLDKIYNFLVSDYFSGNNNSKPLSKDKEKLNILIKKFIIDIFYLMTYKGLNCKISSLNWGINELQFNFTNLNIKEDKKEFEYLFVLNDLFKAKGGYLNCLVSSYIYKVSILFKYIKDIDFIVNSELSCLKQEEAELLLQWKEVLELTLKVQHGVNTINY